MAIYTQQSDDALATLLREGDEEAFTVLYERYHAFLYHFSLKFLKSPEMSEGVVHDVFLKLWEGREKINPTLSLKGYLTKICKNHVLNLLSRALREQGWKNEALGEIQTVANYARSNTEDAVIFADYERLVEEAITQLPAQRQKIFRIYRQEDKPIDEIAQALSISKGTVKDHLLKANRYVRDFMRQHSGIPLDILILILLTGV